MITKEQLQHKIDYKTKPLGSLGKLEALAVKIGMIQNTLSPQLTNPTHIVFAADHGLVEEGVSPYPKEVTYQMVMNFLGKGAAINVFCKQHNINLKVVDAGVDFDFAPEMEIVHAKMGRGTQNIMKAPAMTVELCQATMNKGAEIVTKVHQSGSNIISFGEMGIGNTSAASLLLSKFTGLSIETCTGKGAGHDDEGLNKKIAILEKAASLYDVNTPLETLATFGGFEIAMMCGAMLQAKKLGMVILVDGFITSSAMLTAAKMDPAILDNSVFCHCSGERGHKLMLDHLGVEALLDLNMRLGEGTGAAIAYPLVESAVLFLNEMASFEDAGVSNKG